MNQDQNRKTSVGVKLRDGIIDLALWFGSVAIGVVAAALVSAILPRAKGDAPNLSMIFVVVPVAGIVYYFLHKKIFKKTEP